MEDKGRVGEKKRACLIGTDGALTVCSSPIQHAQNSKSCNFMDRDSYGIIRVVGSYNNTCVRVLTGK